MSIRKDLVIKISNGSASLDMPLQIYEKDHGIELRFKLMDYKYKYDKDPDNILNSNKEDILEAYTTIVNPLGYELRQINGEVVDDTVKFMIEDSYTDELEELGIYKLQIHVKCEHSEFSIPPVEFEVLERLKGMPLYAQVDEGVVDYSTTSAEVEVIEIVNGKLQLVWRSGEIITSTRLNAMVDYANSLHDEINELSSEVDTNIANKLQEQDTKLQQLETNINTTMDESITAINTDINTINGNIDTINAQQATHDQKISNIETNYAQKSELEAPAIQVEGSFISCDSTEGYAQNVEVLGNTIQNVDDLADIRSVGDDVEGQEAYKIDIVSGGGKNLFDRKYTRGNIDKNGNFVLSDASRNTLTTTPIKARGNFTISTNVQLSSYCDFFFLLKYDKLSGNFIDAKDIKTYNVHTEYGTDDYVYYLQINEITDSNLSIVLESLQIEVGTVATEYEPYQEQKLEIFSPVQLEKVEDVADRLICKDGVWGVEKSILTVIYDGSDDESWTLSSTRENTIRFVNINSVYPEARYYRLICNRFVPSNQVYDNDIEGVEPIGGSKPFSTCIGIKKAKLSTQDVNGFKQWLNDNQVIIKYVTPQPQFIPLPHGQQVKLRTFANKTNIHFETEIDGTIKAQIPQSITSTISTHTEQIDNLNKELNRVTKLEESTVTTVTTESDFITVGATSNGYFDDVKLEGKTLVNLFRNFSVYRPNGIGTESYNKYTIQIKDDNSSSALRFEFRFKNNLRPSKYTIMLKANSTIATSFKIDFLDSSNQLIRETAKQSSTIFEYMDSFENIIDIAAIRLYVNRGGVMTSSDIVTVSDIIILEGDHTQNPPRYFEGLKSVGQDVDEMTVESVNVNEYTPHKDNKKPLLYYNPTTQVWEKPVLREWDSIEKHSDGKYYYHKRCREVVYDGTESWLIGASSNDTTILFYTTPTKAPKVSSMGVCDNFRFELTNYDTLKYTEFVYVDGDVNIRINRTRLSAQDSDGFNQWLQANPTTVVYQLATEEVYECVNIDLITYAPETNYIVNAGVITPLSTLKVMCNINNVVRELQQKVSNLENYIQHVMLDALNNALNE